MSHTWHKPSHVYGTGVAAGLSREWVLVAVSAQDLSISRILSSSRDSRLWALQVSPMWSLAFTSERIMCPTVICPDNIAQKNAFTWVSRVMLTNIARCCGLAKFFYKINHHLYLLMFCWLVWAEWKSDIKLWDSLQGLSLKPSLPLSKYH